MVEKREREKKKRRRGPRVSAHNAPPPPESLAAPILEGARGQAFPFLTPSTEVTAGFHESLETQTHPCPTLLAA